MTARQLPSQEYLNSIYDYNSDTGCLYRKPFTDSLGRLITRYSNKPIGSVMTNQGGKRYYKTTMNKFKGEYLLHRIIFKMVYGEEPDAVDHINGNGLDNRLCNLRSCTHSENHKNRRISSNNRSGVVGVSRTRDNLRWRVRIKANGRCIQLGEFKDFDEAVRVRKKAEEFYSYHENNGKRRPL